VEPHKNIPSLVQAIISMKGHEDVKLMVVGDGNVMEDVQAQAAPLKERAKFVGMISYDDIPQYYAASDIIVFPSIYEGLGNVVLEAMASCRPILASDVNGINEAFVKGTGYLFEPNAAAIKEKLEEVVADEGLRRSMGEKGRKAVADSSWRNVAKRTVAVCKTVLDRQ
jgi:glycosyltransferase involved in cell wall biosynthesis